LRAFSAQHPQYYNLKTVLNFEISCSRHSGICIQFQLLRVSEAYNKGKPFQNVRFSPKLFPFTAELRNFVFYFLYPSTVVQFIEKFTEHISIVKPTKCTISQIYFIWEQHSTCFGRPLRPSSGV
jgi:hypothetical protein